MACDMFEIAALYKFTPLTDIPALLPGVRDSLIGCEATGTLLLAPEGVNGTLAAPAGRIEDVLRVVAALPGCATLDVKRSTAQARPFGKLKVRLKREIVTMGVPDVDPTAAVGRYVAPHDWNDLIARDDVVVIDTRNAYETAIGTFQGAVDPGIETFRDFPAWWQENRAQFEGKKVAMFCTGGIRCEKSTNYLLSQDVDEVFHLKGGILKYLEDIPQDDSRWDGACFVFDERVSVEHGLREGPHDLCRACRGPIDAQDKMHADYEEGVSCPRCHATTSAADKARFRERQHQIALAKARGQAHLGA